MQSACTWTYFVSLYRTALLFQRILSSGEINCYSAHMSQRCKFWIVEMLLWQSIPHRNENELIENQKKSNRKSETNTNAHTYSQAEFYYTQRISVFVSFIVITFLLRCNFVQIQRFERFVYFHVLRGFFQNYKFENPKQKSQLVLFCPVEIWMWHRNIVKRRIKINRNSWITGNRPIAVTQWVLLPSLEHAGD